MAMRKAWGWSLAVVAAAAADDFDALNLAALRDARPPLVAAKERLGFAELASAPKPLAVAPQSALLVVKTGAGNWCKLRVRIGGAKAEGGAAVPAFHLERFVTFSADPRRGALADRKDVLLFSGFAIDLDNGQIVPPGLGADLTFSAAPELKAAAPSGGAMAGPGQAGLAQGTLAPVGGAELFLALAPLAPPAAAPAKEGFAGNFSLDAAGRWQGRLVLKPGAGGKLSGTFVSAETQAEAPVDGELRRPGKRALVRIRFPRADLELEGFLWPNGARFAGTARMQEQEFGFVADRQP